MAERCLFQTTYNMLTCVELGLQTSHLGI